MTIEQNNRNLEKLLGAMNTEAHTPKETLSYFKKIVDFAKKIEQDNIANLDKMSKAMTVALENLKGDNSKEFANLKGNIEGLTNGQIDVMGKSLRGKLTELDIRISQIKDGKDADEEKIIEDVVGMLSYPEMPEIKDEIDKATKSLKKEIDNLKKKYDKLKGMIKGKKTGLRQVFGGAMPVKLLIETPSGTVNNTNKIFTTSWTPEYVTVNGQAIYPDNGYTLTSASGVPTVTFETAPATGSIIRSHYYQI